MWLGAGNLGPAGRQTEPSLPVQDMQGLGETKPESSGSPGGDLLRGALRPSHKPF